MTYVVAAGNESAALEAHVPAAYDEVLTATAISDTDGYRVVSAAQTRAAATLRETTLRPSSATSRPQPKTRVMSSPHPASACHLRYLGGLYGRDSGTSFASPLVAGTVALCIFAGPCAGLSPPQIVGKIVSDAAAYNTDTKNSGYGYAGDPLRPISGKYYGYLIRAGLY